MKYTFFHIAIFLSLFSSLISTDCIKNQNCLEDRGECINNICECYDEYWTLEPTEENKLQNIFCNYSKRSRFLPLILEFFIPGLGHIFMKKYFLGIFKIFLIISLTILFYTGFNSYKSENEEGNENKVIQNEEQIKLINNDTNKEISKPLNEDENKKIGEKMNNSDMSEEIDNCIADEAPYVANREKISLPFLDKFLNILGFLGLICFFVLYVFDLFAYGFGFYKDSNNVPFA